MSAMAHLRAACERHLLIATHNSITVGAVVAVLKAVLMLGDSCSSAEARNRSGSAHGDDFFNSLMSSLDDGGDMMGGMPG